MDKLVDEPLVSVIVPFYNIEDCVDYCLSSLLVQDFGSYEIVCVNDGSTDETEKKLKQYEHNPKISIFHKANGGLSNARNYGVKHARGRYITFVDGDDIVSPYYLSSLVDGLSDLSDGMVVGAIRTIPLKSIEQLSHEDWTRPACVTSVSKRDLIQMMMYEEVLPGAWCRLAPRRIYENNPFPEGCYYEEIRTACTFVSSVSECKLIDEPIYGYVMRSGSIVHRQLAKFQQAKDYIDAIDTFCDRAKEHFLSDSNEIIYFRALHLSRLFRLLSTVEDNRKTSCDIKKNIRNEIKSNRRQLMADSRIACANKARLTLLSWSPSLYEWIFCKYDKYIKKI